MAAWGMDFTWLGDTNLAHWLVPIWGICLLLYIFDIVPVIALLPPLIASFGHGTLWNSSGSIGHTTQIITLALLSQWLAAIWVQYCQLRRKPLPNDFTAQQLAADWARQVIMSTYVVSAISKLLQSKGLWVEDAPYMGLQIMKALGMAKYGDYGPGRELEWLAQFMLEHPLLSQIAIGAALPLELFAFVGLLNRRMALFFGIGLFLFHSTITEVLHLGFVFHKILLVVLFINPVWWLARGIQRRTPNNEHRTLN